MIKKSKLFIKTKLDNFAKKRFEQLLTKEVIFDIYTSISKNDLHLDSVIKDANGKLYIKWKDSEHLTNQTNRTRFEKFNTSNPMDVLRKRVVENIDLAYFIYGKKKIIEDGIILNK